MNWSLCLIISLVMIGCSSRQPVEQIPDVMTIVEWRTFDCGQPPGRDRVEFRPVVWKIIDGKFTLVPDQYANLGDNMSDLIMGTKQLIAEIQYYLDCISSASRQ